MPNTFENFGSKVGIGTREPPSPLEVQQSGSTANLVTFRDASNNAGFKFDINDEVDSLGYGAGYRHGIRTGTGESLLFRVGADNNIVFAENGNVGIGTTEPTGKLEVKGGYLNITDSEGDDPGWLRVGAVWHKPGIFAAENDLMLAAQGDVYVGNPTIGTPNPWDQANLLITNGNVGIGTTEPQVPLDVVYPFGKQDETAYREVFRLRSNETSNWNELLITTKGASDQTDRYWAFQTGEDTVTNAGNLALQPYGGNVGIGTDKPGTALDVRGTINATGGITTGTQAWPDAVLEETYELRPLEELEEYIGENGHLPDIPSAEDVARDGINLGEMQAKLLEKIEELTLYVLDLKTDNAALEQRLASVEAARS